MFKDEEFFESCMNDVVQRKQIKSKISNIQFSVNNINGCNILHKYNSNNSNDNLRENDIHNSDVMVIEKDLNGNNKCDLFNYVLPNLSEQNSQKELNFKYQVKNVNSNHLQSEKYSHLYTPNFYANPANVDNINRDDKTSKLKYSFRHLERDQYNLCNEEESEHGLRSLFCYQQESECINLNINNTTNVHNSTSSIKEPHYHHHQLNFFENYFNNYLKAPKLNTHNKFRHFDINGENASKLSTYQNKTKIKLFNTENESYSNTNEKDSNNLNHNFHLNKSYSSSSHNNSVQGNITSNSVISDSIITINSDEKQKSNDSNAYYGPRIRKTSKMFPSVCSFRPY